MKNIKIPEKMQEDFEARIDAFIHTFVGELDSEGRGKKSWGEMLDMVGSYVKEGFKADSRPINVVAAYIVISSILEEAAESLYKFAYPQAQEMAEKELQESYEVIDDAAIKEAAKNPELKDCPNEVVYDEGANTDPSQVHIHQEGEFPEDNDSSMEGQDNGN